MVSNAAQRPDDAIMSAGTEDAHVSRTEAEPLSEKKQDGAQPGEVQQPGEVGKPSDRKDASEEDVWESDGADTTAKETRSFWQLWAWKPVTARYDPANPPKFTLGLNLVFAFVSDGGPLEDSRQLSTTFTVANLYYNQPILNKMAETFGVSFEQASSIATLTQAGYATGLLFICPLGDIVRRRPFILGLIAFTATLWIALCLTKSFQVFAAVSYICGVTTVTPQLMLPLVGDLAPPHRRASSLALVVSGLSLGILVARLLSGVLANYTDWRNIYWFAFGAQYLMFLLLYIYLPDYPSKNPDGLNYFKMLWTILHLLVTEPLLLQASLLSFLVSAVFTSYWTTLSFLLSSPPFDYSSVAIGLFGLIGIVVICSAPIYSRLVLDKIVPLASTILGLVVEIAGVAVGTFIGSYTVAGPIVQAIAIDVGAQFAQIANRSAIYSIQPKARNRVNTAYMVCAFSGQLTGTAVGNRLYAEGGWVYSGSCSIAFIGLGILICLVRGPREKGWFGWSGGWKIRRDDLPPKKDQETPAEEALDEAAGVTEESPS